MGSKPKHSTWRVLAEHRRGVAYSMDKREKENVLIPMKPSSRAFAGASHGADQRTYLHLLKASMAAFHS